MSIIGHTILYIHGMGGGADSRIPAILRDNLQDIRVVCRTYDFDPETAHSQISSWLEELKPDIVIGESLGSLHALRIRGVPVILVSPALNTPFYFRILSWVIWLPGMKWLLGRIYRPREGDRQPLRFTHRVLKKYRSHGTLALERDADDGYVYAFFGTRDHYRRSGVVSIRRWEKCFGKSYSMYDGTHFMEDEHIFSLLIPLVCKSLYNNK